jgi:hydrogenase expression/formation protein HypE
LTRSKGHFVFGKLSKSALTRLVLPYQGLKSNDVVVGPSYGVDVGICRSKGKYLVTSTDPVTGVISRIGTYAVNVSANDVATSGAKPEFLTSVVLLPPEFSETEIKSLFNQIDSTSVSLGISILGGHTEITPFLDRPVVVTSCFGYTDKIFTAKSATPGDYLAMTKTAGIEGTAILANIRGSGLRPRNAHRMTEEYLSKISVVKEARLAASSSMVHAMHDATEGGVLGASEEMADSSKVAVVVKEEKIPVSKDTSELCKNLRVDPLRLVSSGVLLLAVKRGKIGDICALFSARGFHLSVIGEFTKGRGAFLKDSKGGTHRIKEVRDEIWRFQDNQFL